MSVHVSSFWLPDSNSTMLPPIDLKFDRVDRTPLGLAYFKISAILLRYNSLPCGTECFSGCREELRPTSKKKKTFILGRSLRLSSRDLPLSYNFSCWSPPSYNLWEVFTAFFLSISQCSIIVKRSRLCISFITV